MKVTEFFSKKQRFDPGVNFTAKEGKRNAMGRTSLSRRDLVGRMSMTAIAASLGPGWSSGAGRSAPLGPAAGETTAGARIYNVRDYGARGDGKTLDTKAFQAAIDACTTDQGGIVLVPAGTFLIGSIELKSNVMLHLAPAAHILGSTDSSRYKQGVEESPYINIALIYAADAENISVEGKGTIDGQGAAFRGRADKERPVLLVFWRCRDLWIRDINLRNSAFWCTHINGCSNINIDGLLIHSRVNANNDGLHFEDCQHLRVSNCGIACGDDACGLFGGNRDVTITNSAFSTRWSVFRFGQPGFSDNITISNCVIYDTFGCPIKMQIAQGTRLENIMFSNLVMNNVTGPIYIGLGTHPPKAESWWYWTARAGEALKGGTVRNIVFDGIRAMVTAAPDLKEYPWERLYPGEERTCINLTSVNGQFVEDISFSNIHVTFPGGGTAEEAARRQVIQLSGNEYFTMGVLPAYGMYARNVRGLSVNNMRLDLAEADLRPALVFDNVEGAALNAVSAEGNAEAESLMRFTGTGDALLTACRVLKSCRVFLQVEGTRNGPITVAASDLSKAAAPLKFTRGAEKEAVKLRP